MDSPTALDTALVGIAAGASVLSLLLLLAWLPRALGATKALSERRSLAGTLARVVVTVPAHGIGRIAYTAHGKRCSMPAKNDAPEPIAIGTEVLVVSSERGVAVVMPFPDQYQ